MSDYKKLITATFLAHCSPDKAYKWLSENWKAPQGQVFNFWERSKLSRDRKILEYLLLRRKNSLIDLGLAQYGLTPYILRKVFARGRAGVRCSVLANPVLFDSSILRSAPVVDLAAVVKRGNRRELEALALNPYLPDEFYEHLLTSR